MAPSAEMDNKLTPKKNLTFAVNYEVPVVHQFMASTRKRATVEDVPAIRKGSDLENDAPNVIDDETSKSDEATRRSARGKQKKELPLERARVRYDMQLVPTAKRNPAFLEQFPPWWLERPVRRSSRLTTTTDVTAQQQLAPFQDDSSVIWFPSKRCEWEDSVFEMTAVCTSAAIRRHSSAQHSSTTKPFYAPLSKDYIRDRVDIDDPLNGVQIRHRTGGWLQGFLMWTNFTTWSFYFKWDSLDPMSGITDRDAPHTDVDGSLSRVLEEQPRFGDPLAHGVVFQGVAEISLVGGLQCGEYLLRMALAEIRRKRQYKFVVLQATDTSKPFYEKFGFVRVGAVCRYGKDPDAPMMGYRHWTHANESERSLEKHGGPSYMMCLKLPLETDFPEDDRFMEQMKALAVEHKPTVEQLGASGGTPGPKPGRRSSSFNTQDISPPTRRPGRPPIRRKFSDAGSVQSKASQKRSSASGPSTTPKRKKVLGPAPPDDVTLTLPKSDGKLTYAQKQYQNVWLAVPPSDSKDARHTPRTRDDGNSPQSFPNLHSIRGADGKFARNPTSVRREPSAPRLIPPPTKLSMSDDNEILPVDKLTLLKQKVKSYPRSRVHYYNRVVRHRAVPGKYYFVLQYDEESALIRIVPMEVRGVLTGKREGQPRYQAVIQDTTGNFQTVSTADYMVVPAAMVMKTPIIAHEAWDVEE